MGKKRENEESMKGKSDQPAAVSGRSRRILGHQPFPYFHRGAPARHYGTRPFHAAQAKPATKFNLWKIVYTPWYYSISCVLISTSLCRVLCTGHLLAISSILCCCA